MSKWSIDNIPDLSGKVAIVTGANSGLGYHTAEELARKGAAVTLVCRSQSRGEKALAEMQTNLPEATLELMLMDQSDLDSITKFSQQWLAKHDRLDLLINNAGVVQPPYGKTKQGFELQVGTNLIGPYALTAYLLPAIKNTLGARIVSVASAAHRGNKLDIDDLNFERRPYKPPHGYSQSKIALLLWTMELDKRLKAANIDAIAVCAHPGFASTGLVDSNMVLANSAWGRAALKLGNATFANTALEGALCNLYAAVETGIQGNDYIGPDGFMEMRGGPKKVGTLPEAKDTHSAQKLWMKIEEMTGLSYEF